MKKILFLLAIMGTTVSFAQANEQRPDFKDLSDTYASFQRLKGSCGNSDNVCLEVCSVGANTVMNYIGSSSLPVAVDLDILWQSCYDATTGVR